MSYRHSALGQTIVNFYLPYAGLLGSLGSLSGAAFGQIGVDLAFTAPAYDASTWCQPPGSASCSTIAFDAGSAPFSGNLTIDQEIDPSAAPYTLLGAEEFDVNLSGTADAELFMNSGGVVYGATFTIDSASAAVTYQGVPEPSTWTLTLAGLLAAALLSFHLRNKHIASA